MVTLFASLYQKNLVSKWVQNSDRHLRFFISCSAGTPTVENYPGFPGADDDVEQTSDDPPTIVVYVIDPFSSGEAIPSSAGMLRCFAEMLPHLSENIRGSVVLQVR